MLKTTIVTFMDLELKNICTCAADIFQKNIKILDLCALKVLAAYSKAKGDYKNTMYCI